MGEISTLCASLDGRLLPFIYHLTIDYGRSKRHFFFFLFFFFFFFSGTTEYLPGGAGEISTLCASSDGTMLALGSGSDGPTCVWFLGEEPRSYIYIYIYIERERERAREREREYVCICDIHIQIYM